MEPTWPGRGEQRGHPRSWFWTSSTIPAAAEDAAANAGSLGPLGLPSPPAPDSQEQPAHFSGYI